MSPTSKDQHYRIISEVDEKLHLHEENLKKVIDKGIAILKTELPTLKGETLPVAILSVIGGALQNESFFFTNALWEYLDDSRNWFSYLTTKEIKYAKRSLLSMKRGQMSKDISSGVFSFPPLVLDIKIDGYEGLEKALVFLMYCHVCPTTRHIDDGYSFERFLSLACSGIMEIFKGGKEQLHLERLTKEWNHLDLYSDPKPSFKLLPEEICPNKVIIHRTRQSQLPNITIIPVATVISIEDSKRPFLDNEGKLVNKYGWLEYHRKRLEEIMQSIGKMSKLNAKRVFQFEPDPHNTEQFHQGTSRFLQASEMERFFESCVEVANDMKSVVQQLKNFMETEAQQQLLPYSSRSSTEGTDWNTLLNAAFADMTEKMMSHFLEKWVKTNLSTISIVSQQQFQAQVKSYYETECFPNLVTQYKHHFKYVSWHYFVYYISDRLNNRFGKVFETLKNVNDRTEERFKTFGYFSEANFEKVFQQITKTYLQKHEMEDKVVVNNLTFAISKLNQSKFKPHNEDVANEEKRLYQKIIYKIKQFYKKEMSRYLEEYCVFAPEELEVIHNRLQGELMKTFRKCCSFTSWDDLKYKMERVNENVNELKSVLQTLFVSIQQENLRKIDALGERMIKAVFNEKLEYRRRMKSIIKDYPAGMDTTDMFAANETVRKQVKENLKRKIFEIRKTEPMDLYLLALQKENNDYWTYMLEQNEEKLSKNTAEMAVEAKEDDDEYFSAEEEIAEEEEDALFEAAPEYMAENSFKSQEWFTKLSKNKQELFCICVEMEAQIEVIFNNGGISEMEKTLALDTVSMGKNIALDKSVSRKEVAKAKELIEKLKREKQ